MKHFPHILLGIYLIIFTIFAFNPYDRINRWAENSAVMVAVFLLVITYKKFRFSDTAYGLMAIRIIMHTIGGHYTFERVPFDRFNNFFEFERNMYDRVAHYAIGLYSYPLAEFLQRKKLIQSPWILFLFPIFAIFTLASAYEIIEWWYAVIAGGKQGIAFLGSQGDIRDAQKDMLADGLGATTGIVVFWLGQKGLISE